MPMFGKTKENGIWIASSSDWRFMFAGHDALYIAAWRLRIRVMKARDESQAHDVAIHVDTGARYYNPAEAYYQAEEYECAMMALDKAGVPRADESGKMYSIFGRACRMRDDALRSNDYLKGRAAAGGESPGSAS